MGWQLGREVWGSHPNPASATILVDGILGQVVYSLCLPSLLSSKKLGYIGGFRTALRLSKMLNLNA